MAKPKEGATATGPNGQRAVFRGGAWQPIAPGAPAPGRKLSPQEQKELNTQLSGSQSGLEAKVRLNQIAPALGRLKGGPWRGAFLDAAIPSGEGFLDALGGALIGGPARLLGAVSGQDVKDYQQVRRAAILSTRQSETGERGTQTEGDAARAIASTVSASTANPSAVVNDVNAKADRQRQRSQFYAQWANARPLNAPDDNGVDVESAFQNKIGGAAPKAGGSGITIRKVK